MRDTLTWIVNNGFKLVPQKKGKDIVAPDTDGPVYQELRSREKSSFLNGFHDGATALLSQHVRTYLSLAYVHVRCVDVNANVWPQNM